MENIEEYDEYGSIGESMLGFLKEDLNGDDLYFVFCPNHMTSKHGYNFIKINGKKYCLVHLAGDFDQAIFAETGIDFTFAYFKLEVSHATLRLTRHNHDKNIFCFHGNYYQLESSIAGSGEISATKHTPGPWSAYSRGVWQITTMNAYGDLASLISTKGGPLEMEANAKLIAAAPELLELAKENLAHQFELHRRLMFEDGEIEEMPFIKRLRAVISKAGG